MSPCVWLPGLLVIVHALRSLFFVLGIQLAGLLEHPAFSVGVIGWLIGHAMNMTRVIEYAVQTGRPRIASFERLFPLTGFRAIESGIDCRVFGVVTVFAALVSVATWSSVSIFGI